MRLNKKIRISITDGLLMLLVILCLFQAELVSYLIQQGSGQLRVLRGSQPIDEILVSNQYTEEQKYKIHLIQDVKAFSVDVLNFNPSRSYSSFYDQQGKHLLRIVTACEPYSFKEYEWQFPLVGKVSYKGYFDVFSAEREFKRLKNAGWDADVSPITAWSTLGYFSDPVFSEMLKKSNGELIELIFHELFHGTIYAPSEVESNENMADFVAEKATLLYLKDKPREVEKYLSEKSSQLKLDSFALHCMRTLDSVYVRMSANTISDVMKASEKKKVMGKMLEELKRNKEFPEKMKLRLSNRLIAGGNAFLMHYQRYSGLKDSLERVFFGKYEGNLPIMIKDWKMNIKSL